MLAFRFTMRFSQPALQQKQQHDINRQRRRNLQVSVVGASGGIGQALSLLLKMNPLIETLVLHDVANTKGVAADLSHICTSPTVKSYTGEKELKKALKGSDIVVVPAGRPRRPGMDRKDLLESNANVAIAVAMAVSSVCPSAFLAIITNPVNTIVPIVRDILKSQDSYDPKRLFGITTLDVVRAKTFLGQSLCIDPQRINIPVIGGHSGITILPLFSQSNPPFKGDESEKKELIERVQEGGSEVVKAKAGSGSATLSMAFAGAQFVGSLIKGIKNEEDKPIVECAFVESNVTPLEFFASPVILGPSGIKDIPCLPELDQLESQMLQGLLPVLLKDIEQGVKYANNFITSGC
ncbi:uncharacterized protein Dwil_GK22135 [Drosophila willistoni]|uniref:Malate dehydrogenase n=1 Tax=Drosophila willistoni TaxID=7260 RepID=B4MY57_DROWI|nr:malate dehydrogenase [Drosophila willistoni]EDW77046.2 uncharacterized protein Dwil_GK22135 [Drosophila willistoni]